MKKLIKDIITFLLWLFRLTHPSSYSVDKLIVVTFHRVLKKSQKKEYPLPGLVVTEQEFDWILSELNKHFNCGTLTSSLNQFKNKISKGKPPLAITFDDGQMDNYENALPILEKYGIKGTFYIPTDFINSDKFLWHDIISFSLNEYNVDNAEYSHIRELLNEFIYDELDLLNIKKTINSCKELPSEKLATLTESISNIIAPSIPSWAGMMTWSQVKSLSRRGHEIGSHSRTHPILTELNNKDALIDEIRISKDIIEKHINKEVYSFCYPNGDQDLVIQKIVSDSGYKSAVTTQMGINGNESNFMNLLRIDLDPSRIKNSIGKLSIKSLHFRLSCINQ